MQQVLFRIPFPGLPDGIPVYGFGAMLFLAFVVCTWIACRRAQKEGIRKEFIQDLAIWLLIGGIIGARLSSVVIEAIRTGTVSMDLFWQFFRFWDGGLILYGSIIGGLLGYVLAYLFVIRRHGLDTWKLADIIAPSIAVGICLGRLGCFLNGCCYGGVACPECAWQVHFPLSSPPRFALVHDGYQTPAGFTISENSPDAPVVGAVEPGSAAEQSGLRTGDVIVALRNFKHGGETYAVKSFSDLDNALLGQDARGINTLSLTVKRGGAEKELPAFKPQTLGLIPTQLYESISMLLLFLLLTAYLPFRRRAGEVMALLMFGYGLHRTFNEMLRDDARPVAFEKYISIFLIGAGLALWIWLRKTPVQAKQSIPATAVAAS